MKYFTFYQLFIVLSFSVNTLSFVLTKFSNKVIKNYKLNCVESSASSVITENQNETIINQEFKPEDVKSKEISKLLLKIEETQTLINDIKISIKNEETLLNQLDEEYGSEITRIKKEFARIKERSYEEANDLANKAKVDAIKEILPISDNYLRAKQIYLPIQNENEEKILNLYDNIFIKFNKLLEEFGITRVESIGQPFDFNVMEAIMTSPSTEYHKDIVITEYQVGYRMGDKCVRPAMVVVSSGPGPSN